MIIVLNGPLGIGKSTLANLGEPFDVSATPPELVVRMLRHLGQPE